MTRVIRDSEGKIIIYRKPLKPRESFEVTLARHDERMERMESNSEEQRAAIQRIEKKQDVMGQKQVEIIRMLDNFMVKSWSEIGKISGADGKPGLEDRLSCAEQVTKPVIFTRQLIIKFWPVWTAMVTIAAGCIKWWPKIKH